MRAFTRWLPAWLRAGSGDERVASVYMSRHAVAVARGHRVDGRFAVSLRVDPIDQVVQSSDVLKLQAHDIGVRHERCNLAIQKLARRKAVLIRSAQR